MVVQIARVLGHARLSLDPECTGGSWPHPSPPCSRSTRVTRTLDQTRFLSSSAVRGESSPHSCPSSIRSSWRCCTWAERSAAYAHGRTTRCPATPRLLSAGKAAAEFRRFLGAHFQKTSAAGILAGSPRDTCSPISRGLDYASLSSRSSPPLGAFLRGGSFHLLAGNGRAYAILTAIGGGLTWI